MRETCDHCERENTVGSFCPEHALEHGDDFEREVARKKLDYERRNAELWRLGREAGKP